MKRERTDIGILRKDDSMTTLYLSGINYRQDEKSIKKHLETYGDVTYVRMVRDRKTNLKKGIAYVQMPNEDSAMTAIANLNNSEWDGRTLKVSIARNKEKRSRPRARRRY
jgi:RNA recognition motif-containing protein